MTDHCTAHHASASRVIVVDQYADDRKARGARKGAVAKLLQPFWGSFGGATVWPSRAVPEPHGM